MPTGLKIEAVNLKQWVKLANDTAKAFTAPDVVRRINTIWGVHWRQISRNIFASEGGKGAHGNWQPLSEPYRTRKSALFPGKGILRRTDRMYKSLTTKQENISTADRVGSRIMLQFGSRVPIYPEVHQKGIGLMPRRRALDPTRPQLKAMAGAIGGTLIRDLRKRGWFDGKTGLGFRNTGFDSVQIE